jgi:hypothetical protein
VTTLHNGHSYQCPASVDAAKAATSSECHRLAAPRFPSRWKPTLLRVGRVKECLHRAGLIVAGSAIPPSVRRGFPGTPIAGLLISDADLHGRPTVVNFYLSKGEAVRAYNRTLPTITKDDQGARQRGPILYTWNTAHPGAAASERRCIWSR